MTLKLFFFSVLLLMVFLSLGSAKQRLESDELTISILPLGEISDRDVGIIKDSIHHFCSCSVKILGRIVDPHQIMIFERGINPFDRSVFYFLDSFATKNKEKIIGITDIPFQSNDSSEGTIRGFSKINGISTIISNAQIIRDAAKHDMNYDDLLIKVVKHELGHLFGIGHCPDTLCIMTSSFPTPNNFLQSRHFCDSCSAMLQKK